MKTNRLTTLALILLSLLMNSFQLIAAEKEGLVLLPIQGPELDSYMKQSYRVALQESFASRYQVYSGEDVDRRLRVRGQVLQSTIS